MSPVNTRLKLCSSLVLITFYYLQLVFKLTINQFENLSKLIHVKDIEITSWLVSAYDFYSRVVKGR